MLSKTLLWTRGAAMLLLLVAVACGDDVTGTAKDAQSSPDGGDPTDGGQPTDGGLPTDGGQPTDGGNPTTPTVISNTPIAGALEVPVNASISATFSEEMDPETLTGSTFTLTSGPADEEVLGSVFYVDSTVVFWPDVHLASQTEFTATITTGARSAFGVALAALHTWIFTTDETVAPLLPVDLGTAGDYVILAKSGISTVPASAVTGDLGVSPAAATYITGFSLSVDATNAFATSTQVTGKVFAADYALPTPANLSTAVGDMGLAFIDAAGRAPSIIELGAGNIGGMTLAPGVYKWGTSLLIPTNVSLTGSATDVWIFQVAGDLTMSSATSVLLSGGALAKNVFWQVAGLVALGTTAHLEGVILTKTSISLRTGASVNGRLLAQTAVTIAKATVVEPAP
jgi:hypothetical protein